MKKLLLSACLFASIGTFFTSCDNGQYDANPNEDYSGYVNPNNPKGGVFTDFSWTGESPMTCYINGDYWKADAFTLDTATIFNNGVKVVKYVSVSGTKTSNPKNRINLYMDFDKVKVGEEIPLNWDQGYNGVNYYRNLDSANLAVINKQNYSFVSGYSGIGRAKILEFTVNKHIKAQFYVIVKNPQSFYISLQKGYIDITK